MKKIYLLGAAFLISLGITGCTPATTATPPASKPASTVEQQEKEVSLTIYRPTEDAMYLVPVTVKMKLKDDPPMIVNRNTRSFRKGYLSIPSR